jgi:rhamnogalacturonan endolyase
MLHTIHTIHTRFLSSLLLVATMLAATLSAQTPPSLMENLGRGVVAVRSSNNEVFVSWRFLGTDPENTAFNLYRVANGGAPVKLNASPITGATNFQDTTFTAAQVNEYYVRPVIYGNEEAPSASFTVPANATVRQYLRIPLQVPPPNSNGTTCTYEPNDLSVGDLDGDGEYEIIVKWYPTNAQDNSNNGTTGSTYLDAYKLNSTGAPLWRIDLGKNIRSGAHYTQFMVYDLDGDGIAEIACKTADGTIDGVGTVIGDGTKDYRNSNGYVLDGPEYLTVFDGRTGKALNTVNYLPARGTVSSWGDNYGNRVDRFLACVAYLDGQRPSLVMCRGYYTRTVLVAWDFRDGQLTHRWTFDSSASGAGKDGKDNSDYAEQGNHNLTVADVDGDGKDEIIYGSCTIDDDGRGLYSTGLGHGDAMHVSDMIPTRPGLEVWVCHETTHGHSLRDAATGEVLMRINASDDTGRAAAAHIDARYPGYHVWGSRTSGVIDATTQVKLSTASIAMNFLIWWDGDLQRELLDGTTITKWNGSSASSHFAPSGVGSGNGTKANPGLSGDILGDWREELIVRETGNDALRIYTTTAPTTHRIRTLMHDRQYRLAIAWQNVAYNQPPHTSFYIGAGMEQPPAPNIVTSLDVLLGPVAPVITAISDDTGASDSDFITNDTTLSLHGTTEPGMTVSVTLVGAGPVGSTIAGPDGAWSLDCAITLSEGTAYFTTTATDGQGHTGVPSAPFPVTILTTPPPAPAILNIAGGDTDTVTFAGTAEPGATVTVTDNVSGILGATAANADGLWNLTHIATLSPGNHTFTATITDIAGNTGPASAGVTINTQVAIPAVTGIENNTGPAPTDGITNSGHVVLRGTATPGDTITVTLLGGAQIGTDTAAPADGAWSIDCGVALADGSYAFSAAASNAAGAGLAAPVFVVTVDTTAPAVASVTRHDPASQQTLTDTFVYKVTFSEPVTGLANSSFTPQAVSGSITGVVTGFQISADDNAIVHVTVSVTGEGTLRLNVDNTGLTDSAGNSMAAPFTAGETYIRSLQPLTGDGTWTNADDGLWGDPANWNGGVIADGSGKTANFNTLNLTKNITVTLDAARTLTNITFGDTNTATAGNWTIAAAAGTPPALTLATGVITVNALGAGARAIIEAPLAGTGGLTKSGVGTLVLAGANTLTGALTTSASSGTFVVGAGGRLALGNVAVSLGEASAFEIAGGSFSTEGTVTASGNNNKGVASSLIVSSGSARIGTFTLRNESGSFLLVNGGTLSVGAVTIPRNSAGTVDYGSGFIVKAGEVTAGTVSIGTGASNGAMSVEGGKIIVTGVLTVGNQATASRGGGLRVTGGSLVSTDTVRGLVLSRVSGSNANNVATASFTGGSATFEKISLGYDSSVNAGSATVTLNGGVLYLGSGGIIKNGASGMTTTITLSSGTLGAKDTWTTTHAIALSGHTTLRAADAAGDPHDITLSGALSGSGTITKTGAGVLILAAANTATGPVTVSEGTLTITGSLASSDSGAVTVASGATLAGTGAINRPVVLQPGAGLALAPSAPLTISSGRALTKTGAAQVPLSIVGGIPTTPGTYTLATFGSTGLTAADFAPLTGPSVRGTVQVTANALQLLVVEVDPNAELLAALDAAEAFIADASIGAGHGQYPQTALNALNGIITAIRDAIGQPGFDAADALANLQTALATFTGAQITVNFSALDAALDDAADLLDDAADNIGEGHGQYPQTAIDAFAAAIGDAQSVRDKLHVTQTEIADALAALEDAMETFEDAAVVVDFSALDDEIAAAAVLLAEAAPGAGHGQHPQTAIDAFTLARAAALAVSGQAGATPAQVAAALGTLQNATSIFTAAQITVDFSAIDIALDDAETLLGGAIAGAGHGQYPQTAIDALTDAIDTVQSVRDKSHVTQTEIDDALTTLENAMGTFGDAVVIVDFTALLDALDAAETLLADATVGSGHGQHTQADIDAFAGAIAGAKAVATTPAVTQAAVNTACSALQDVVTAFTGAAVVVDFSALDDEIAAAAALLAEAAPGAGYGQYPQAAIDAFDAAIAAARAVSGQTGATPVQVAAALGTLQNATTTFIAARGTVDFTALLAALAAAENLLHSATVGTGHGQHAQADIDTLDAAITEAGTVTTTPAVTQAAINAALVTLQNAVDTFRATARNMDLSALESGLDDADALLTGAISGAAAGEYPPEAMDVLAAAIGTVKALASKPGVTQTEIDTAQRLLAHAVAAFEAAQITAADVAAPRITRHPVPQTIYAGATASFTAAAAGNGLRYQWQKDGVDIAGATTDALFVTNAQYADAGVYRVIVTNDHGAATSYDARLTLEEPPGDGGGGAPAWPLPALLAALLALRAVITRRRK